MMTFDKLNLNKPLLNALADMGFEQPTPIQEKVFAVAMSGRDVLGIAQTGTGKTLAYLLPCLRQWKFSGNGMPQVLIVVPTRELVVQVVDEIKKLTAYMNLVVVGVYGGANIKTQKELVHQGVDVLVATPGRLIDLNLTGVLRFKQIKRIVIDEVDEMLNLGFKFQLAKIIEILPPKRQTLLFSATMTKEIEQVIGTFCVNPQKIVDAPTGTPLENIKQSAYLVPNYNTKINLLHALLANQEDFKKVLLFAGSKKLADRLFEEIQERYPEQLGVIHSNKAQNNRFNTVKKFHAGDCRILIATDLLARGIDISEITHVINFNMPDVPENYMHRMGRTGRAEQEGTVISFILPADAEDVSKIEQLMNQPLPLETIPDHVEISTLLTADEIPKLRMKIPHVKLASKAEKGLAYHEKSEKNKKVNKKIRYAELMKIKYKRPKTRGQKPKRS